MNYSESTKELVPFFRQLANDIETLNLSPDKMMLAGQMYMMWKFHTSPSKDDISDTDAQLYLITGWYIHQHIEELKSKNMTPELVRGED